MLLTDDAHIKIGDFGESKTLEGQGKHSLCGTPFYLSPRLKAYYNQLRAGQTPEIIHNPYKSDVYSLGITMLQTAIRNLHTECSPRKLITKLKNTYSQEFCYMLWEMVEPHETLRMDLIELNKRLQGIRDKTISLPHRFRSLLEKNSSFTQSILSIYKPVLQEGNQRPVCVVCKTRKNSSHELELPCSHLVCGLDCLAKIVAELGFENAKCSQCNESISRKFLHSHFKKAAQTDCSCCKQPAFKYHKLFQCHHSLCREHLVSVPHDCRICHVPYDFDMLRKLHRKCSLF